MEPNEIEKREFLVSLRGYDRDEVDSFAREVAQELRELKTKLAAALAEGATSQAPGAAAASSTQAYERVGEDTSKILLAAEQVGEEIREKARREAAELMTGVRAEAEKLQREAEAKRQEAEDDLRKLREARTVLATQLEDVGRRLDESVARLRAPVEAAEAGKPSAAPTKPPASASATAPASTTAPAKPVIPAAPAVTKPATPAATAPAPKAEASPAPAPSKPSQPAPGPAAAAPAAAVSSAPPKTEGDTASLETLLQQIRTEREEGRKEVEAALASSAPASKAPAPAAPPEPAAPKPAVAPAPTTPAPALSGMLAKRESSLGEVPKQAARRLKRLLQEDQNALLDLVRTQRGKGSVDENLVPTTEHHERFKQGLDEPLRAAFSSGRSLGGAGDPGDATTAIETLVAKQLVGPLRAEISKTIGTGLEAQESANALGERASDVFRVWKGVRTELLGEGMVYAAFHQGLIDAWKSSGQKEKKWVLSSDELECPKDVCKANAAAGPVALDAGFPSGHLAPPAHGGCDCTLEAP